VTEAEWLACRDPDMLRAFLADYAEHFRTRWQGWVTVPRHSVSDRKLHLFHVACCRRVEHLLPPQHRQLIDAMEAFADGLTDAVSVEDTAAVAHAALEGSLVVDEVGEMVGRLAVAESTLQADLFRDIVGNPFRPVRVEAAWFTDTARALARAAYDGQAWDTLPVLADALQDAGCADADLLGHLRSPGPHVRGCWALDLVLGKE
jgi:hypothetical protein